MLRFHSDGPEVTPGELVVKEVSGREAMSTLYEYELLVEAGSVEGLGWTALDGLLRHPCHFVLEGDPPLEVHGVLRTVELLEPEVIEGPARYRLLLVPRLWKATRSHRSRVYQELDVEALVTQVLAAHSLEATWDLQRVYPTREYVVQYEETDFAFLSRQLEHWGIYYYFEQTPDGEQLVISDHDRQFQPLAGYETLTYNPRRGRSGVAGSVHSLRARLEPQPAELMERDYNWRMPSIRLALEHPVDQRTGHGVRWCYGEHFKDEDEGKQIAQIRAEQILCRRELYSGTCSVSGLAPGHTFELFDSPVPDLNIKYLVTAVEPRISLQGDSDDEAIYYRFTAFPLERDEPETVPYRAQRTTAKPQIHGFMHGFIDGEVRGAAAPIDELGRYRVILPMDTADTDGERLPGKASRQIRMVQPSAGPSYGMHFPLHVGTEVLIIHLDGDPDRPVILGAVPNAEAVSPVVQESATKSRIRTKSGIVVEMDDEMP